MAYYNGTDGVQNTNFVHTQKYDTVKYNASSSRECMGVNGEALQLCVVYKHLYFFLLTTHARIRIRYYKSCALCLNVIKD